jgi:two-component system response regulator HydG
MTSNRVLIVHSDPSTRMLLSSMLQSLGLLIEEAGTDRAAVRMLEQGSFNLVLASSDPGDPDALELLCYTRRKHPRTRVVQLFTGNPGDRLREALQWGAASVLRFPASTNHLRAAVAQALGWSDSGEAPTHGTGHAAPVASGNGNSYRNGTHAPEAAGAISVGEGARATERPQTPGTTRPAASTFATHSEVELIGEDANFRQAVELAISIAHTRAPVLIVGERGTGKNLLARYLHAHSPRHAQPVVFVDCAAYSENELETELFGRKQPGYAEVAGRLAQAQGGTLVLDQVAALSPTLQYKLLRVLQEGRFEPVGSSVTQTVDVRLIATSREDLKTAVESGHFRQDLYYRLSVITLNLPPLRHRGEDVVRLADHFRARYASTLGRDITTIAPDAQEALKKHAWKNNLLELESVIQRAVLACRGPRIETVHLDLDGAGESSMARNPMLRRERRPTVTILPLKEALEEPERQLILQALQALNWNRQETARVLDINRTTLYKKMKKYGLLFDEPAWAN